MFCILAALLLSFPLKAQEAKLLSYTREFDITGMDAKSILDQLFEVYLEYTGYDENAILGESLAEYNFDHEANVFEFRATVKDYASDDGVRDGLFGNVYDFYYTLSMSVIGNRLLFEMTEIHGRVNGEELNKDGGIFGYMTEGPSGVRGGLYGSYWRKHDRILREYLQDFFIQSTQLMYDSVTGSTPFRSSSRDILDIFKQK